MAKQIVIIETNTADGGSNTVRAVFWFAVPVARRVPRPDITASAYKDATAAEMTALQDGSVLEEVKLQGFPASQTGATIKATLVQQYTDRATYLATLPFKLQFYGVFYDGAVWSL